MKKWHHQRGMTAIGWLLVLGLIAFFTLITLRLVPLYMEFAKISSVFDSLVDEPDIGIKPRNFIVSLVAKRFNVNDVREVSPKLLKISKEKGLTRISIEYERREHLMSNIDIVASFDKTIEVSTR
ncbi:hypothetical protein MNBD_GAMMA15-1243 [hydrothermal vent metagenome]|uniref:DUF4845 domain-containing protein n=1 Tax=hydrothermal vent metagenome TaxID=652676 RepID=A0A3B0YRL2_9ZZZZ